MLQHKIHVSCFHLSFNCSRLVRFFSSNMFLRPIPPPPIFILHWKMWYNELMVSFQHLLLFLPTFDHSVYCLCCYRSTCLGRRWNISTTIMLSACFTLFTIWLTRLGLLINYGSYHFFMDALSKCWSSVHFRLQTLQTVSVVTRLLRGNHQIGLERIFQSTTKISQRGSLLFFTLHMLHRSRI